MAVGHPQARIGDVQQDVHRLPGTNQHGVLPDQVRLDDPVPGQDQEAPCPVDMERMVHRMVAGHLVE